MLFRFYDLHNTKKRILFGFYHLAKNRGGREGVSAAVRTGDMPDILNRGHACQEARFQFFCKLNNSKARAGSGNCSELAPAEAGIASWQVGGGVAGRSFIAPQGG
jgi:hypothetical protein